MDVTTTERQTYGSLDFLGDIGGLAEVLYLTAAWFLFKLSRVRLDALMINRLYHLSSTNSEMQGLLGSIKQSAGVESNRLVNRPNGEIGLGVPRCLAIEILFYKCCCCREYMKGFKQYK
jgi:hypothetical protein